MLIYISTDYVFDGENPPYNVNDKPNPLNFYGKSKLGGEEAVRQADPQAVVLRVPVLYGETEYNAESAINILLDAVKVKGVFCMNVKMKNVGSNRKKIICRIAVNKLTWIMLDCVIQLMVNIIF